MTHSGYRVVIELLWAQDRPLTQSLDDFWSPNSIACSNSIWGVLGVYV